MTKRHAYSDPLHIGYFKINKFKVNKTYQREFVWSKKEMQFFIDSIIKDFPIPQVFIRKIPGNEFEIVDGQQRLTTIQEFLKDEFTLSVISKLGKIKYSQLPEFTRIEFDNRKIPVIWLDNYDDEDVRSLFRRLQSGRDLNTGEKLNAFPGSITLLARKIADHPFFNNVNFSMNRYRALQLAAQIILLVNEGITDIKANRLYEFFDFHKDDDESSSFFKKSKRILNYMNKIIKNLKLPELRTPSWFINYFIFTKELMDKYNIVSKEKVILKFYQDFFKYIEENKKISKSKEAHEGKIKIDIEAINFVNNNRAGTNNRKNIQSRIDYLREKFFEWEHDIEPKDIKRGFDETERIAIYRRYKGICQNPDCLKKVKFEDFHADHKIPHSRGGKTIINNAQVLCSSCNTIKSNNLDCGY